jgi:hypothetical protein
LGTADGCWGAEGKGSGGRKIKRKRKEKDKEGAISGSSRRRGC